MKTNSRKPKRPAEAKTSRTAKRKGDYVQRRVRRKTIGQLFAEARKSRAYKDEGISLDMDAIAQALRLPFVLHKSGRGKPGYGSGWSVQSLYPHPQTETAGRGETIQECAPTLEEAVAQFRARVCAQKRRCNTCSRKTTAGSILAVGSGMLADADGWATEYWTRQQHYYEREAWRDAAHYEDLAYAAEGRARDIRRLMELSKLRQPKSNADLNHARKI